MTVDPIPTGKLGRAYIDGVVTVQVDVKDAAHQFADITDGDTTKLTSCAIGSARILWVESGTGTKWAAVRLGDPATLGLRLGLSVGDYTGGDTISLHPCDSAGVATGDANVTVQVGWTFPTVDGDPLKIASNTMIPYQQAADEKFYCPAKPTQAYGALAHNYAANKLRQAIWLEFGWFRSTSGTCTPVFNGHQYQVLQLDADGNMCVDWVRFH